MKGHYNKKLSHRSCKTFQVMLNIDEFQLHFAGSEKTVDTGCLSITSSIPKSTPS